MNKLWIQKIPQVMATLFVVALIGICFISLYERSWISSSAPVTYSASRIGIVNMIVIKGKAKSYIQLEALREKLQGTQKKFFLEKENELRHEFNELSKLWPESTGNPPEAYVKRKQELDKRVEETETLMQERRQSVKDELTEVALNIEKAILDIIHDIGEKQYFQIILNANMEQTNTSFVLYGTKNLDITEEVLQRLDKKIPHIKKEDIEETKPSVKK